MYFYLVLRVYNSCLYVFLISAQLNEITPYIDGNLMYGVTKQWADQLRKYKNGTVDPDGKLAYSHDGLFPEYNDERLPLANPPPPFYHGHFIKEHETAKVSRFFSKYKKLGLSDRNVITLTGHYMRRQLVTIHIKAHLHVR